MARTTPAPLPLEQPWAFTVRGLGDSKAIAPDGVRPENRRLLAGGETAES